MTTGHLSCILVPICIQMPIERGKPQPARILVSSTLPRIPCAKWNDKWMRYVWIAPNLALFAVSAMGAPDKSPLPIPFVPICFQPGVVLYISFVEILIQRPSCLHQNLSKTPASTKGAGHFTIKNLIIPGLYWKLPRRQERGFVHGCTSFTANRPPSDTSPSLNGLSGCITPTNHPR